MITTLTFDAAVIVSQLDSILRVAEQKLRTGELTMTPNLAAFLDALRIQHRLYFAPIRDSEGKRYVISVTASGGAPGNALDVFGTDTDAYGDGEAWRNGERIPGDIAFQYGCTRP